MNTISINGVTITGRGNISIVNGKVLVDGKDVTPDSKQISIVVNGNIEYIDADCCEKIEVTGDVNDIQTQSGDVEVVGDVKGSVQTMSGDVKCSDIGGSVKTMSGDIKHRKPKI